MQYLAFAVVCENYTFHSFTVTMTECWSFGTNPSQEQIFSLSLSMLPLWETEEKSRRSEGELGGGRNGILMTHSEK